MSPTVFTEYSNQKEVKLQQYRLCLAMADYRILGGKNSLFFRTWVRKELVNEEQVSLTVDSLARKATQVDFS